MITKILIILILLTILLGLVALRYRRQIHTALYLWRVFRKMRQMNKAEPEKKIAAQDKTADVRLVRCARCKVWIQQSKALNLRSKTFYCSTNCMEKAVAG